MTYSFSHKITGTQFPKVKWVCHNEHCMWISVPKNANMQLRKICTGCNMDRVKYHHLVSNEVVCVLRNPRTRLFSALGEFKKRKRRSESIEELLEILLEDADIFDEHLEPQCFYVSGTKFTHILQFENLHRELNRVQWFAQNQHIIDKYIDPQRLLNSQYHRVQLDSLAEIHKEVVDAVINKYYAYDLELWQNHIAYQGQTL